MDGTSADFIVIPIVAVISLAAWLVPIYWADSHPRKSPRTTTVTAGPDVVPGQPGTATAPAGQGTVPRQATAPAEDHDLIPARR